MRIQYVAGLLRRYLQVRQSINEIRANRRIKLHKLGLVTVTVYLVLRWPYYGSVSVPIDPSPRLAVLRIRVLRRPYGPYRIRPFTAVYGFTGCIEYVWTAGQCLGVKLPMKGSVRPGNVQTTEDSPRATFFRPLCSSCDPLSHPFHARHPHTISRNRGIVLAQED